MAADFKKSLRDRFMSSEDDGNFSLERVGFKPRLSTDDLD
jgi:hypothetical protein